MVQEVNLLYLDYLYCMLPREYLLVLICPKIRGNGMKSVSMLRQ
jgi:hypothetical protein